MYERSIILAFWQEEWFLGTTPCTWNFGPNWPRSCKNADFQLHAKFHTNLWNFEVSGKKKRKIATIANFFAPQERTTCPILVKSVGSMRSTEVVNIWCNSVGTLVIYRQKNCDKVFPPNFSTDQIWCCYINIWEYTVPDNILRSNWNMPDRWCIGF